MPTEQEYDMQFLRITDPLLRTTPTTKRDAIAIAEKATRELFALNKALTSQISQIWKQEAAQIKAHNDQMQRDLKSSFVDHHNMIYAIREGWLKTLKK